MINLNKIIIKQRIFLHEEYTKQFRFNKIDFRFPLQQLSAISDKKQNKVKKQFIQKKQQYSIYVESCEAALIASNFITTSAATSASRSWFLGFFRLVGPLQAFEAAGCGGQHVVLPTPIGFPSNSPRFESFCFEKGEITGGHVGRRVFCVCHGCARSAIKSARLKDRHNGMLGIDLYSIINWLSDQEILQDNDWLWQQPLTQQVAS